MHQSIHPTTISIGRGLRDNIHGNTFLMLNINRNYILAISKIRYDVNNLEIQITQHKCMGAGKYPDITPTHGVYVLYINILILQT